MMEFKNHLMGFKDFVIFFIHILVQEILIKKTAKLDKSTKLTTIVPHETPINSGYVAHLGIFLLLWKPC